MLQRIKKAPFQLFIASTIINLGLLTFAEYIPFLIKICVVFVCDKAWIDFLRLTSLWVITVVFQDNVNDFCFVAGFTKPLKICLL